MPSGPTTAVIRGFQVPLATLDRFLRANGARETDGWPPFHHRELDDASELLCTKIGGSYSDNKTRLFVPYNINHNSSTLAYVAYAWVFVMPSGSSISPTTFTAGRPKALPSCERRS